MHIVNDKDAAVGDTESPKVTGKIIIEFMDDNTFLIKWPEAKVGYLTAIGALHVAINDLYVRAAGIQVKLPSGELGDIEDVDK